MRPTTGIARSRGAARPWQLHTDTDIEVSTRNKRWDTVYDLTLGAVNAEVTVALPSGKTVVAVITRASCEEMELSAASRSAPHSSRPA